MEADVYLCKISPFLDLPWLVCAPSNCLGVRGAVWRLWGVFVVGTTGWPCFCRQLLQVQAFHDLYDRTADAEGGLAAGGCGSIAAAVQVQLPCRRP